MKKIMLCCSAGMSTSLLMKKMIDEAEKRGLAVEIRAFGVAEFAEQVAHYQVVLLGRRSNTCKKICKNRPTATGSSWSPST
ncbi:N,N'-diacetylchitobiose-specific phosphotransferase enzyme IIB component [Raoultella terrigena]|uniref:N,N'-diacetylchitobiose-specific phosphotransferase enzyme IIB component n=1 Tax=Raoultella terrigena TaxID=577 RepID=A0A4U9CZ11_RAOTE|nr:N,N'-diacetylchitobiose-specific phosphotransferase enzyme IIB component [Raoultella terrigena]